MRVTYTEPDLNTNHHHQLQDQNTHSLNSILDINQNETQSTQFLTFSKFPDKLSLEEDSGRLFHYDMFNIRTSDSRSESHDDVVDDNNSGSAANADEEDQIHDKETAGIASDKARHNLATRVMSNGVEVIIAGDKNSKASLKSNALRTVQSLSRKPMTLAPSTLKDQMILVMPSNAQEKYTIPINSKHFITKTCLTTYTYRTTYLQNGKTTIESREKVVSNTATEQRNYLKIKPTETLGITLSRTPELAVGVFHTTYTYYNTILDGEHSIVVSSQHVLTNTITGPDDYISFLQPSEVATPVLETNTYYTKISLTKTFKDSNLEKLVSTSNILTQVIITESMQQPPQTSSITASYVAFDSDETTATQYSYFNTDDENVENQKQGKIQSELLRNTIIPSSSTSLSSSSSLLLPSSTAMALELQGSLQTDMHIYATKTFLTTFTYFTTLMNTGNGNGNEGSNIDSSASTVVNFHTRVIENVITESIPSYLINSDLLSTFETQLRNPLNQNNFVTMITLGGGQSLEVTAMNILHPSLHSYDNNKHHPDVKLDTTRTKLESNSLSASENNANIQKPSSSFENSNEILDSEVASSENEELLADQYLAESDPSPIVVRNNTKIVAAPSTTDFASVNQLIGSFDLNRFQALGPVFNAMAGLIQNNLNNFGTNTNSNLELKKNASSLSLEGKQVFKNISTYSNGAGAGNFVGQSHEGPIYIPVQSLPTENSFQSSEKFISPGSGMQGLHISPPVTNSWFNEATFNRVKQQDTSPGPGPGTVSSGKPKYETPLLNGGIAISPGEVITANSDVIVGKPNGIQQPRVPYNNKISDSVVNPLLVPPSPAAQPSIGPYSYQFQHQQIKVSPSPIPLSVSSLKYDQILKPPSIKPHSMQYNNQQQQHQHTKNPPPHGFKNVNYRAHYATSHMHHPSQHYIQPTQKQQQPRIPFSHLQKNHQIQWPNAQLPKPTMPNYIPYAPFDYDQQYHPPRHPFQNISNNEILEIKRIPEVYSTDLPASAESPTTNSSRSKSPGDGGIYKAFVKKVINPDKPMLVDIQPSKIKNIVFPHDNSASILVVESSVELHKNGQYYDEPTTYPDALMTGSVTIASSSSPNNAANAPARKPILSNQQINLDMNVLSHNVDINAPPITFNKDSEFPLHSTPVRGQIHKTNLFKPFKMPHVTIPITDNQIQVNLTPQNIITQNLSGHFVNDVQTVVNSDSAGVNSENLDLSSYDTYSSVGSSQNQLLSEGEIVIDHQKQLQQQQLQPQTQQQQFEQQKQLLYQHHQQKHNIEGEQQQQFGQLHQQNQQPQTQQKQYFQQQQQKQQVQQRQQQKHQHQQQHEEEEELQQQQLPVEYLKPLESSFFFDSSHHTTQNKPNSLSFSHSNNKTYHSYPNVIPIRANIESSSNSAAKKVFSQNFPTQLISKKTTTTTEDTLQIFAKVKPNIHQQFQPFSNIMVDKQNSQGPNRPPPVSDHMPLVNLFYNSPNEEGSSNKLPNRLLHPTKDDSNRVDDQNPSSSLNIGVLPSASQRDEEEISNSSNDETIFESSQITKTKPSKSQPPTHPSSTTKTPIPVQPSPSTINHMDDLDTQLPPPSLKNLTTLINLLSSGRPFIPLTSKISTKSPLKNTTIPKLVYHNGEGFKGRPHATDQTQNAILEQPTRPVVDSTKNDAKQQQQYNNILTSPSHQTETPFNPKYTKRTKKPSKTPTAPITLVTDIPSPITTQLDLNQMEVLNQPNDNGNRNISYADVFDYHETVNPNSHNHKFMPTDELEQRTTTIQTLTLADMRTERPIYKNNKDRYQFASEPSTDMKPPKELSIKPQTEKVLGLNPPPPPPPLSAASAPSIPINNLKPTIQPNSFGNFNLNLTERNRSPTVRPALKKLIRTTTSGSIYSKYNSSTTKPRNQKPKPKPNISEKPPNYTTTTTTTTKAIAKPTRPQTLIKKPAEFSIATTSLYPFIQKTSTITPSTAKVAAVPSIKEKLEVISQTVKKLPPTSSIEKSAAADSNQESMIFLAQAQEIPEEILIEGSEKPDKHYQTKSLANSFTENLKQTNSPKTNKKTKQSESNQNHPKQQQSTIMLPTLATNSGIKTDFIEFMVPTQARSTSSSSSIIFPTKYITKPHYLTVTTTKLSISTSLGVPVTQTLTLTLTETKTSTLVDTVTETHTLLQPTRVTESHTTTATATATATQIIHYEDYEDHHHHHHSQQRPAAKIKPTIEVVDNVLLASRESENDSVETLRIPAIPVSTTPTKAFDTAVSKINANLTQDFDNNSIFVVMTDKNSQGGIFSISPSMMDTPQNINAIAGGVNNGSEKVIPAESPNSIELDYDYNITFDYFPTRDEEAEENEVNHVLLGGVLIAAPPRSNNNDDPTSSIVGLTPNATCRPLCKASRNELCQLINNRMQCLCRPGFARMFPDRPCRPTYTYALEIPIHRISKQILHFNEQYRKRDSNEFKELADITHNAVDRMIMQSDLRDVYHGVHVTSFDITNSPETEGGILGKFLIQVKINSSVSLSDSSDEKRLVDVFKKYLRLNSFSLGGTETFTTQNGVNSLQVNDFNECAHNQFHDCSENSRCFNLQGTYTCSCQEGFVDLSENSIYPGRICSAEVIGCEKCHFHGKCIQSNKTKQQQPMVVVCECFSWYTGASCQLNLKIVLIALITIGTILFILLLFCVLITCTRRNRDNNNMQSFMSGMQIIAPKNNGSSSAKNLTIDRRAMIKDSSSEGSENSLPYVLKRDVKKQNVSKNTNHHHTQPQNQHHSLKPTKIINQRGHPSSGLLVPSFSETSQHQHHNFPEQNDRSLTVMIPRAKYHHSVLAQTSSKTQADGLDLTEYNNEAHLKIVPSDTCGSSSKASTFHCNNDKIFNKNSNKPTTTAIAGVASGGGTINSSHGALLTKNTGALVSAGFEVSATVGSIVNQQQQQQTSSSTTNLSLHDSAADMNFQKFNYKDTQLQYNNYKDGDKFIDSMDVWIDTIQQNELAAEARSFNETTIQAPTKSLRCTYERQLSQSNGNDEANTMAERDVGSTCLLPHTHLYKPDRDSDVSGFDSF
ncbi:uncharacterized protein LOC129920525 [Episyrphus balteatus]|uniref:uncharacterized protein LOC129920525 n=1 Tax=Episyrphus balteatus TaxID=286459 RepID=UPI002484D9F1|nr:uncharacterized protein LOC129920525 [Episyrphus balteatus]